MLSNIRNVELQVLTNKYLGYCYGNQCKYQVAEILNNEYLERKNDVQQEMICLK